MAEPYVSVDEKLRGLAGAAEGFGSQTLGGKDGPVYIVTNLNDSGPGSLREACDKKEPLWIVFSLSGTIRIVEYIRVRSYKTIDGRGQSICITGNGLHLKECCHVIICNLRLDGGKGHDVDAIQIKPKSQHVWIDRCSLSDFDDGLIDITRASTDITISRCHFSRHNKTMLIGADPKHVEDRDGLRVTIHRCFFDGTTQRHPRVRFGKVHLYNNYTRSWGIYAVCASIESQVLSQSCIYEAGSKKKAFEYYTEQAPDKDQPESGSLRSEGDLFLNGAEGKQPQPHGVFHPTHRSTVEAATPALMEKIKRTAGWQNTPLPPDSV